MHNQQHWKQYHKDLEFYIFKIHFYTQKVLMVGQNLNI